MEKLKKFRKRYYNISRDAYIIDYPKNCLGGYGDGSSRMPITWASNYYLYMDAEAFKDDAILLYCLRLNGFEL